MEVSIEPRKLRVFKNEKKSATLRLHSGASRWASLDLLSLVTPFGLEGTIRRLDPESAELTVKTSYAGRFNGLAVRFSMSDVLRLFREGG